MGKNPYFELDGEPLANIHDANPNTITSLIQMFPKSAVKQYGVKAADGAYIIQSQAYARVQFELLFSSFSKEYAKIINSTDTSAIQYILNGKILTGNFEGKLSGINRKSLKEISIIDQGELSGKFQIANKSVGVVVTAKLPNSKPKNKTDKSPSI